MKTKATLLLATLASWLAGPAGAAEISLESAPPVVVKTFPAAGATDVDPALTEIKVTYSKVMLDGSWSWSTWGEENFPETTGAPHYEGDGRTCVLPVKLQPGKFYATWLNSDRFKNFKDASGKPAVPYLLTFTTATDAGPGAADDSVLERTVDKTVSDFPASLDLSTPEGACAAWQRANARWDVKEISKLSLVPLDPKREEEWYRREEQRDPEGLKIYLKAIADSKIIAVQTWRGELANVVTLLAFPEGKGRQPYSSRCFGLVNGEWKNLGEDRLPTLDAARSNFNTKKENLWRHYKELKAKATTAENESGRKFVRVVLDDRRMTFEGEPANWKTLERLLAEMTDRGRTVLEWAVPSTRVTLEQHDEWTTRFAALARRHGFEYSSYVGVHPFGSKGGTPPVENKTAHMPVTDPEMALLLNGDQKAVLAWTDRQFRSYFDAREFAGWSDKERAQLELRLIDTLKGPKTREYYQAINTLGALNSTNALCALRAIAYDRADKNNRDRWMTIRTLGMIGDRADVPPLIHLVYHGNVNTRWWAQISLVRLTGQNFGSDWEGWGNWWNKSGGSPAFDPEIIRWWSGQPEAKDALKLALNERDAEFLEQLKPE